MRWHWTAYVGDASTQDEQGTVEAPELSSAWQEVQLALYERVGEDRALWAMNTDGVVFLREAHDDDWFPPATDDFGAPCTVAPDYD